MNTQFSSFLIDKRLYGINVQIVQEITKALPVTSIPLAPEYVHGLINLRGQIATAIGLRELFSLRSMRGIQTDVTYVVCKCDGVLLSLVVDEIGDVIEVPDSLFEPTPDAVSSQVGQFMTGVYKLQDNLLTVIDAKKIIEFISK